MPLDPEAVRRFATIKRKIEEDTAFIVFVWGPGAQSATPQARKRQILREDLEGVVGPGRVLFSEAEELRVQREAGDYTAEYIQARSADAVLIIAESYGALTEAALYQGDLLGKAVVFTTRREVPGFARVAYHLLVTHEVEPEEWSECSRVRHLAREFVESLRVYRFRTKHPTVFDWDLR